MPLLDRLRPREFPGAVQDFLARSIEAHDVIPAGHDVDEVGLVGIAVKVQGNAAVCALLGKQIVDRIGVVLVLLKETFGVIDADGPEAIHRYIFERQRVSGLAIVLCRSPYSTLSISSGFQVWSKNSTPLP
jgi:hypothetical protein